MTMYALYSQSQNQHTLIKSDDGLEWTNFGTVSNKDEAVMIVKALTQAGVPEELKQWQ